MLTQLTFSLRTPCVGELNSPPEFFRAWERSAWVHTSTTQAGLCDLPSSPMIIDNAQKGQGKESTFGALAVNTGEFTGRSPMDRFIVKDNITKDKVWWGDINIPFESDKFDKLYDKVTNYLSNKEVFGRKYK